MFQKRNRDFMSKIIYDSYIKNFNEKRDVFYRTPLMISIINSNHQLFNFHLSANADINATDIFNKTPLIYAIELNDNNKYYYLNRLLDLREIDINKCYVSQNNVLISAIIYLDINYIYYFLSKGVNVNHIGRNRMTALSYACIRGDEQIIRILVGNGANINVIDDFGNNCLFYTDNENILKLLIGFGANINIVNNEGETVIEQFYKDKRLNLVKLLLEIYVHLPDNLMELAISNKDEEFCKELMKRDVGRKLDENKFVYHVRIYSRCLLKRIY